MYIPFSQLPDTAKVWVYQASRMFTSEEIAALESILQQFSKSWDSHGVGLKNSFAVLHNRFIIIAVDETMNGASGCSIDKSVNLMKDIETQLKINLLDKTQIAFIDAAGEISTFDFRETKAYIENQTIHSNTIIFNNLVNNIADFQNSWKTEIGNTWLSKYFK